MQPPSSQQTSPSRDAAPLTHRTKLPKSNSLRADYTPPQPIRPKPTTGDLQGAKEYQHDPRTSKPHVYDSYSSSTARQSKSRYHRFSSSSEENQESQPDNHNGCQLIRRSKRKRLIHSHPTTPSKTTVTSYRFDILTEASQSPEGMENSQRPQCVKPPPVFLHGVINYTDMVKSLTEVVEEEQFLTRACQTMSLSWHVSPQTRTEQLSSTAGTVTYTSTLTNSRRNERSELSSNIFIIQPTMTILKRNLEP